MPISEQLQALVAPVTALETQVSTLTDANAALQSHLDSANSEKQALQARVDALVAFLIARKAALLAEVAEIDALLA